MKTTITIRLDAELKAKAEIACDALDVTLSQYLRRSLKALVSEGNRLLDVRAGYAQVERMSVEEAAKAAAERQVRASTRGRIVELEKLERKNALNRVTRKELSDLRLLEVTR